MLTSAALNSTSGAAQTYGPLSWLLYQVGFSYSWKMCQRVRAEGEGGGGLRVPSIRDLTLGQFWDLLACSDSPPEVRGSLLWHTVCAHMDCIALCSATVWEQDS